MFHFAACTVLLILTIFSSSLFSTLSSSVQAAENHEQPSHSGHSDDLLLLMHHKIALQILQKQSASDVNKAAITAATTSTLRQQGKHLDKAMPILRRYMATPKSYYLTTQMYHDSLENRAAMLADFSAILIEYQKQLVSRP